MRFYSHIVNGFQLRLARKNIKRAKHILALIELIALTRLRLHFSLPLEGEDETVDLHVGDALKKFLLLDCGEAKSEVEKDVYFAHLTDDASSKTDREAYFRVKFWLNTGTRQAEQIAELYRSLNQKEILPITESELPSMFADVRRRYRIQEREHRESKASLIEISLKDLNLLLPWISLLILVSGYFHTSILYGKLGIAHDQFILLEITFLVASINCRMH